MRVVSEPINSSDIKQINLTSKIALTQVTQSKPVQSFNCRICLDEITPSELPNACNCKGSNANVHHQCLIRWIQLSKKIEDCVGKCQFICELCLGSIYLQPVFKLRFIGFKEVKNSLFDEHICASVTILIVLFVCILVAGVMYGAEDLLLLQFDKETLLIGYCLIILILVVSICVYVINCLLKYDMVSLSLAKKEKENIHKQSNMKLRKILFNRRGRSSQIHNYSGSSSVSLTE